MSFEKFLQEKHAENYRGTDDDMPDSFDGWLTDLQPDDFIKYGDEYSTSENAKKIGAIKTEKKSSSSRENGKKGGRPKKIDTENS